MAEPYFSEIQKIVDRLGLQRAAVGAIVCKHFFGAAAVYVDGHIFMTLTGAGLALKVAAADRRSLLQQGATPLRYFARAPVKRDYAVLPVHVVADARVLGDWVARSIDFVRPRPIA